MSKTALETLLEEIGKHPKGNTHGMSTKENVKVIMECAEKAIESYTSQEVKKAVDVFNELLDTLASNNYEDNFATISDVKIFTESWREEMKIKFEK